MQGRVLIIAGSDSSGGAGIQADIKTVTAFGGYAATAITALTVQDTLGVKSVHPVDIDIIRQQINSVLSDIGADVIKIGMIGEMAVAAMIADLLVSTAPTIPIVLDPVLVATSGDSLAENGMGKILRETLIPLAYLVTPNSQEAATLMNASVENADEQQKAAQALIALGARAALVKGGHLHGNTIRDTLVTAGGAVTVFDNPRIVSTSTHGTGCTLASAVATGIAQGQKLDAATASAIKYVRTAIETAPGFGAGHGPLNHTHPYQ